MACIKELLSETFLATLAADPLLSPLKHLLGVGCMSHMMKEKKHFVVLLDFSP